MKATIIGVGNLGGAIARGLARGTFLRAEEITCVDTNPEALERLRQTGLPFILTTDVRKAVSGTDLVIIAVKPHIVREVIEGFAAVINPSKQIVFSAAAGVSLGDLAEMVGEGTILFRIMPNIAIAIGESMTFISPRNANPTHIKLAETIFGEMGRTMVIPEALQPAATAVGSCGIAYAMRYVHAATTAAIEAGLQGAQARAVVLQTIKGAIELIMASDSHPQELIDQITTPGGYTIKGLIALERNGFSNAIISGIEASYSR